MALWQEKQAAKPGSRRSAQATPTSEPADTQETAATTASTSDGIGKTGWQRHAQTVAVAAVMLVAVLTFGLTSALQRSPEAPIGTAARPTTTPSPARAVQPPVVAPAKTPAKPVRVATGAAVRRPTAFRTVPSRGASPAPAPAIRRSRPPHPPPATPRAPSPPAAPATPAPAVPAPVAPAPVAPAPVAPAPVAPTPVAPAPVAAAPPPIVAPPPGPVPGDDDPDGDDDHGDDGHGDHEHGPAQPGGHDHGDHRGPDCHKR